MLKGLSASIIGLGLLMSATPGYCYSVETLGTFTGSTDGDTTSFKQKNEASPIEDYYTFAVTKAFNISASITNAFTGKPHFINDFTIELFAGAPPPPPDSEIIAFADPSPIASGTNTVPNVPPGSQFASLSALSQAAGAYYLKVSGSATGLPSYSGSLAVSISTVPLPSSAPLFGAALVALGAAGYGLKRRSKAAAQA